MAFPKDKMVLGGMLGQCTVGFKCLGSLPHRCRVPLTRHNLDAWKTWHILIFFPHQELAGWSSRTFQYEFGNQNIVRCFLSISSVFTASLSSSFAKKKSALLIEGEHYSVKNTEKKKFQKIWAKNRELLFNS